MKARSGKAISKIQGRAAQVPSALCVDQELDTVALNHRVAGVLLVVERFGG